MKLLIFTIFDSKVGAYSPPMIMKTKGEAVRSFTDAVHDSSLPFAKHPQDYRLFYLGEFDDNSGIFVCSFPEPLIGADEVG